MLIKFPSDWTKFGRVSLIRNTAIAWRQISKRGSISAARNSALDTPYPPLHLSSILLLVSHIRRAFRVPECGHRNYSMDSVARFWYYLRAVPSPHCSMSTFHRTPVFGIVETGSGINSYQYWRGWRMAFLIPTPHFVEENVQLSGLGSNHFQGYSDCNISSLKLNL